MDSVGGANNGQEETKRDKKGNFMTLQHTIDGERGGEGEAPLLPEVGRGPWHNGLASPSDKPFQSERGSIGYLLPFFAPKSVAVLQCMGAQLPFAGDLTICSMRPRD